MKFIFKISIIFSCIVIFNFNNYDVFAKNNQIFNSKSKFSNYFFGIVSANQNSADNAFEYFKKVKSLKDTHHNFNVEFVQTMVELGKFNKVFFYLQDLNENKSDFYEANLLLGINYFLKKDFARSKEYFQKLNLPYEKNLHYENLIGQMLIAWAKLAQNDEAGTFKTIQQIPNRFSNLKLIQATLAKCYFDFKDTNRSYKILTSQNKFNFSRYNFLFANYLLHKEKISEAESTIKESLNHNHNNLLLKQSSILLQNKDYYKIKKIFNCRNSEHLLAEFFYIIANLFSTEENYNLSNFYLKISLFLNKDFVSNKALLAENYLSIKNYDKAKKEYKSLKKIGQVYSWYSDMNLANIISISKSDEKAIIFLKNKFDKIKEPSVKNYYDLANFYKEAKLYRESIELYSLVLEKIPENHKLLPKIFHRRGTSYERLGEWDKAEKDLKFSLKILPEQPHVLNYLAYSWLEKEININESLKMLIEANDLEENDPFIIDSLGWAKYLIKDYIEAEKLIRTSLQLMPTDPIINDHYADILWKLNKHVQARYFWQYVLSLDSIDQDQRKKINNKMIYGIPEKLVKF